MAEQGSTTSASPSIGKRSKSYAVALGNLGSGRASTAKTSKQLLRYGTSGRPESPGKQDGVSYLKHIKGGG